MDQNAPVPKLREKDFLPTLSTIRDKVFRQIIKSMPISTCMVNGITIPEMIQAPKLPNSYGCWKTSSKWDLWSHQNEPGPNSLVIVQPLVQSSPTTNQWTHMFLASASASRLPHFHPLSHQSCSKVSNVDPRRPKKKNIQWRSAGKFLATPIVAAWREY